MEDGRETAILLRDAKRGCSPARRKIAVSAIEGPVWLTPAPLPERPRARRPETRQLRATPERR
ncbi:hypothetical protein B932_3326 [Gluconobacter oxydans H24]|nr:hypothetical protein B932_3326 [Gluconobacter oxydans H24]